MVKPVQIKSLLNYKLWIKYSDGVEGEVDLSHLAGKGVFALWNDYTTFEKVYLGNSGQIVWSDEVDIDSYKAYMTITGKTPEQLFPNLKAELINA
jgi:Protein of unknown function (DUF2442)